MSSSTFQGKDELREEAKDETGQLSRTSPSLLPVLCFRPADVDLAVAAAQKAYEVRPHCVPCWAEERNGEGNRP